MKMLVLIILAAIPLNIITGMSSISPESACTIKVADVQSSKQIRNIRNYGKKKFKRKKFFKIKYYSGEVVLTLGFLMSILSVSLLVFFGTGGQLIGFPFLLGFFGALLCFLSISNETSKPISIIGLILGIIGGLGSVISIVSKSS